VLSSGVDIVRVIGGAVANNDETVLSDSTASAEPSASIWEETRCIPTLMEPLTSSPGVDSSSFFFLIVN